MILSLDRSAPTPLYHQIVQAIRWRIGTGGLRPGAVLPTMREAAERWGVNYHTVRRAYQDLAEQGWVRSVQGSGTEIVAAPPLQRDSSDELENWVVEMLTVASDRFALSPHDLVELVGQRAKARRVVMVECNAHQSGFLARQIEEAWGVEAVPWPLDQEAEPPKLPLIGTYFHHAEMRAKWPLRANDMHFVALYLDPALAERIADAAEHRGATVLHLVEQDPATAAEMARGVRALVPGYEIRLAIGDADELLRSLPADEILLVAPRLWDRLKAVTREDERVLDVRHVIVPEDLTRVWRTLNATRARAGAV